MSARKSSHRTIFLIVSNGSPLALIASSLRSTSKKPVCPMTRSLDPPMAHCGQRVRFVATWREEFFEVPAILRPGRSEEESGPHEQEDQSYVADEVLVERPGGGDAGHPEVPVFGRHEHEEAVCHGCDAHHDSYAEAEHSKHRLLSADGAAAGTLTLGSDHFFGGGTWVSHQSNLVAPRRAPAPGTTRLSLPLPPHSR